MEHATGLIITFVVPPCLIYGFLALAGYRQRQHQRAQRVNRLIARLPS